jgi:hypothetical protein
LLLQILAVVSVELNSISCQYQQQHFPSHSHYEIQQHHPIHHPASRPQEHHDYRQQFHSLNQDYHHPQQAPFDYDKFNQQAKQLQAQVHYFNQQQQKHIQQQINSVHQEGSQPQFDFAVNGNYSDLEKASEQFVNLGHLVGKQNVPPKVIKITKTVAVKQPMPFPYPVPVVKFVKEQVPAQTSHHDYNYPSTTEQPTHFQPSSYFNYSSFANKYQVHPTPTPAGPSNAYQHHHQQHQQHKQLSAPSHQEYDTEPFYITTPQKETIKIVPVPYYIDEHGNKHEVTSAHGSSSHSQSSHEAPSDATTSSHDAPSSHYTSPHDAPSSHYTSPHGVNDEAFYPGQQSSPQPSDGSGKFQSFSYSYHPPTHNTNSHQSQSTQQQEQPHSEPETKYYYTQDSDNSASSENPPNYESSEENSEHQHYRYKYVSYE